MRSQLAKYTERILALPADHPNRVEAVEGLLRAYAAGALTVYANIMETSLNADDRRQRVARMCEESGLIFLEGSKQFY